MDDGLRTRSLPMHSRALYQLSYAHHREMIVLHTSLRRYGTAH